MQPQKHFSVASAFALFAIISALDACGANSVIFDNQSGNPAVVKLVGPTTTPVSVQNGKTEAVQASAGHYYIKVRYGTPGHYFYSKGEDFDVTDTATSSSETTITLHKVLNGNYSTRPMTVTEFGLDDSVGDSPIIAQGKTFTEIKVKAEAGDVKAQCDLGVAYENGFGVREDQQEAAKWFRKAADQGNAKAQNSLAGMYHTSRGVLQDNKEAVKWFRKAAEQGDVRAEFNLGLMYSKEDGVPKDDAEAVKWYRKAAEQGHASAQHDLGIAYATGIGVSKNLDEAVKWFRKAADQDNAEGESEMGIAYMSGASVPKDQGEAIKYFRKASEQGNGKAQFNLSIAYYSGIATPKNLVEAYKWMSLSAAQGVSRARSGLQTIEHEMTADQIEEAKRLATVFKPREAPKDME